MRGGEHSRAGSHAGVGSRASAGSSAGSSERRATALGLLKLDGQADAATIEAFQHVWSRIAALTPDAAQHDFAVRMRTRWLGVVPANVAANVTRPAPVVEFAPIAAPAVAHAPVAAPAVEFAPIAAPVVEIAPIAAPVVEAAPIAPPAVAAVVESPAMAVAQPLEQQTFQLEPLNPGGEPWPFDVVQYTHEQVAGAFEELAAACE